MCVCLDRTLNDFHLNINDPGLLLISLGGKLIPYISISIGFPSGSNWNLGGGWKKVTLWDEKVAVFLLFVWQTKEQNTFLKCDRNQGFNIMASLKLINDQNILNFLDMTRVLQSNLRAVEPDSVKGCSSWTLWNL